MSFLDVVERAKAYLERHHRLSLRALRREFDLDDEALEGLVEELVQVQQVAVLDGKALAWAPLSAAPTPAGSPGTPVAPTTRSEKVATSPPVPEAERRQLTVMFCDLVGSTTLGQRLDSEDFREIMRTYYDATRTVTDRWGGHVAAYMGDGLLVYFGYPQAREDDAERAVRAGLEIVAVLPASNEELEAERGTRLAVRVGIHTGIVVVGELGRHGDNVALGDTMNRAARIAAAAEPDTVVCSSATLRLVSGLFVTRDLGARELKGIDPPMHLHQPLQPSGVRSRLDAAAATGLTPLVGRRQELGLLEDRWQQTTEGRGQAVLLCGEAGIGKSRLVQAFRQRIADRPHTWLECRGSPYTQASAFYPVLESQRLRLGFTAETPAEEKLARLEVGLDAAGFELALATPVLARFHALPIPEDRYRDPALSPEGLREKTIALLVEWLLRLGRQQPAILFVEDLHWMDPSTLDLLGQVLEQLPAERVLLILTYRPDFAPPWATRSHVTPMLLSRLTRTQLGELIRKAARGRDLPETWVQELARRSDGVPLFAEELTRAAIETSPLEPEAGTTPELRIPATLQDSLMARLDALGSAKELAQLASVLGREFDYGLLRAVWPLEESRLRTALDSLVGAELLYRRGVPPHAIYTFKHALIQDAAYQSLLKGTRQQYHARIAGVLSERFADMVETQPELLAHHYTEAGLTELAIPLWREAGERATERSACVEAINHLGRGLELLALLPDTPARAQQELTLRIALGAPLSAMKGFGAPEVEQAYTRARELGQQVGDTPQLFPALRGLWQFYIHRAQLQTAHDLGEHLLGLARGVGDAALLLEAHRAVGEPLLYLGEFLAAREHLEHGRALYDAGQHRPHAFRYGLDPGVTCPAFAAQALWCLGYPDQALTRVREALALAQEFAHPFSRAFSLYFAAWLYQLRGDRQAVEEHTAELISLAADLGFGFWLAVARMLRGWALAERGQGAEGIADMCEGLAAWRALGSEIHRPYILALLAEAYGREGQVAAGLDRLTEAATLLQKTGDRQYEAEVYRLHGTLALRAEGERRGSTVDEEARQWFQKAIEVARRQSAKSLELRAVMSLSRLRHHQGKTDEARTLLAPAYSWFTEGLDTRDLREAKALLEALS